MLQGKLLIMNFRFLIITYFFSALTSCNPQSSNWKKIKKTQNVYPKDSIISFVDSTDFFVQTVWLNTAYRRYAYKKYCHRKIEVTFKRPRSRVENELREDSLLIAKKLLSEFKKWGVAHFVGQILTSDNLIIFFYTDDEANAKLTVFDPEPNTESFQDDAEWKTYYGLFSNN